MKNKHLNELSSKIFDLEELGLFKEAEDLHNIFIKEAAKKSKKKKNVPNDPALYARCKSEAKRKFEVWPSAYGSAYLVKLYKQRGGTFRKSSSDDNVKTAQYEGSNSNELGQNVAPKTSISPAEDLSPNEGVYSPAISNLETSVKPTVQPTVSQTEIGQYLEKSYKEVIDKAKQLLMSGKLNEAKTLIDAVVKRSVVLNDAQKEALKNHFERIKFTMQDLGNLGTGLTNRAYQEANNLIYSLKRKFNLEDKDLVTNTPSYYLVLNEIKKYQSPIEKPPFTDRVKNNAFSILRQISMDNTKK